MTFKEALAVLLIYFLFPLIYICFLLLNYAREQSRVANKEHPQREPVQLRQKDRKRRLRTCFARHKGNLIVDLLCHQMPLQEKNDQRPTTQEKPHTGDQHHGSTVASQYRKIVQNLRRYTHHNVDGDWYFLVMEYCDMGNLYTIQSKLNNKVFSVEEALNIFNQTLRGVEVIHRKKIVHRDLKLENIFVRKSEKNSWTCKIGDFGLARFL